MGSHLYLTPTGWLLNPTELAPTHRMSPHLHLTPIGEPSPLLQSHRIGPHLHFIPTEWTLNATSLLLHRNSPLWLETHVKTAPPSCIPTLWAISCLPPFSDVPSPQTYNCIFVIAWLSPCLLSQTMTPRVGKDPPPFSAVFWLPRWAPHGRYEKLPANGIKER